MVTACITFEHPSADEPKGKVLAQHFEAIGIPQDAARFLLILWDFIQMVDDKVDGDTPEHADRVAWDMLVGLPCNPFYRQNMDILSPVLALQINKWRVCNAREKAGKADAKSYMWRAGYYDIILAVAQLCGLPGDALALVPDLYGETLDDYLREFE